MLVVKKLIYDKIRGRVANEIWNTVATEFEQLSGEKFNTEEEGFKFLYGRSRQLYKKFEPLLKKLEEDEEDKNDKKAET